MPCQHGKEAAISLQFGVQSGGREKCKNMKGRQESGREKLEISKCSKWKAQGLLDKRTNKGSTTEQDITVHHMVWLCSYVIQAQDFAPFSKRNSGFLMTIKPNGSHLYLPQILFSVSTFCVAARLLSSLHQISFIKWEARNQSLSQKPTLTLQVKMCHTGLSSAFHQTDTEKKGTMSLSWD